LNGLDAVLDAFGIDLKTPAVRASPAGPSIPDVALPWHVLRGPAINLSLGVGAITFLDQAWPALDVALQLRGGRMQLGPARIALPGGPLTVSLTVDASARAVPVSLSVQAPTLPMALMAHHAGLPGPVIGSARVDARLHGTGSSTHALAASLDGTFRVTALDGQLSNSAFRRLTSAFLDALGIQVPDEGETAIRCLGLAGSFSKGVALFQTIALETTYLSVEGVGQVDLARETVAFTLRPLARVSGSSVAVPVVVEGPFRAISGRLDAGGFEKLGFLLNAWTGDDQSTACADAGLVPGRPAGR
jgi:uncharacterized protein involved in outer membrane biogenesis